MIKSNLLKGFACALMLSASAGHASNPFVQDKDQDVIKGAERQLGEIEFFVEMGEGWLFVQGENDGFLMTKNGRFAISVENSRLTLTDIWQMKEVPFKDFYTADTTYPLDALRMLPDQEKEPPIWFEFGSGPVIGTLFGIPGNEHVNAMMAQVDWDNADFSIRYYVVPHNDAKDWVRYVCSPESVQKALAAGESLALEDPKQGQCDTRKALEYAPKIAVMMHLMGVRGVPFVVRHSDWQGQALRTSLKEFFTGSK